MQAARVLDRTFPAARPRVPHWARARPEASARVPQPVAQDATAPPPVAGRVASVQPVVPDAVAERPPAAQRGEAAGRSVGVAALRRGARDVAPRREEEQRAEAAVPAWALRPEARASAARLLVAASACRRDRLRLGLARQ